MRRAVIFLAIFIISCSHSGSEQNPDSEAVTLAWPAGLPVYDHILIIVEENKDYEEIINNPKAPYINDVLKVEGANLTQMFGEEHASQGNYFWLFSGGNQDVGFQDSVPRKDDHRHYPFRAPNLGEQLISKGFSFKGYSEGLPEIGFTGEVSGLHARKHVPWISFANVPDGKTLGVSSNLRFDDFPSDPSQYSNLPTVAIVIPNMIDDMHNGPISESIRAGDQWLQKNIDPYYQWAKDHNSLLIITFDENHQKSHYRGLTNPFVDPTSCSDKDYCTDMQNHIPTILAGAHIKPGDYSEGRGVTHVNILRTIEAMYGLPKAGAQQANAARGGITDDFIITDVFETAR